MARRAASPPVATDHPTTPDSKTDLRAVPPPVPPQTEDVGKELAAFEKRIKALEGAPTPWWQYAIVAGFLLVVLSGEAIYENARRFYHGRAASR